jgi:hypothetical protein
MPGTVVFDRQRLTPHVEGIAAEMPPGWTYSFDTENTDPTPVSVSPAVSSGNRQLLTIIYSTPTGYQTLDVVNLRINKDLDGRKACYLAYSRTFNALYIVGDSGDANQISGKVMDRSGTVGNSQCSVALANSSVTGSGNTLTVALDMSFNSSFGGNRVIYAAARDADGNNSDWQTMGTYGVLPLPGVFPNPVGLSPPSGNTATQTITFTYQDLTSSSNLQTVWGLVNSAIDGRGACYFAYYRPGNRLYLYPDDGDGTAATSIPLTGSNQIGNNQCVISAQGASVQSTGNTLKLTLPITFYAGFNGFQGVWLAAQTQSGQTSPWQALGVWTVPDQ